MSENGDDEVSSKGGKKKMADLLKSTPVKTLLECLKKIESTGGSIDADSSDDDGTIEQLTKLCENGAHVLAEMKQKLAKKRDESKERTKKPMRRENSTDESSDGGNKQKKATRKDAIENGAKKIVEQVDSDSSEVESGTEESSDIENADDALANDKPNSNKNDTENDDIPAVELGDDGVETAEPEDNTTEANEKEDEPKIRLTLVPILNLIEPIPSTSKAPSRSVGLPMPKSRRQNRSDSDESSDNQSKKASSQKSKQIKSIAARKKTASTDSSSDSSSDSDSTQNSAPLKNSGASSEQKRTDKFEANRKVPKIVLTALPRDFSPLLKKHNLTEILNEKQVVVASVSSLSQSSSAVSSRSSSRGASTSQNRSGKTKNGALSNGRSNNIDDEQVMRAFVGRKIINSVFKTKYPNNFLEFSGQLR